MKTTVTGSAKVLKLEDNFKNNESSPDVCDFLKHVEESKQKLEENQTKLEEVLVQDETTVEVKDDEPAESSPKKSRDLRYLVFLIIGSLMLVIAFGSIISYYIIAIESKLGFGESTVVIVIYENGTNSGTTQTSTDGSVVTIEPNKINNCAANYAQSQNLGDYSGQTYATDEQHPWPWLATIEYSFVSNQTSNQTPFFQGCGGVFIAENQILTAAHCVDQYYMQQAYQPRDKTAFGTEQTVFLMRIKVGIQINSTYTKYESFLAEEIVRHPNYTSGMPNNDLAVIHLSIQYGNDSNNHLCIMPKFDFVYSPNNIYAIDKANGSADYKTIVQKSISLYNGSDCESANSDVTFCAVQTEDAPASYNYKDSQIIDDKTQYESGDNVPNVDCGKQTSGLPLMQQLQDSSWSLVGIGSFTQNPCSKFTIYTKLDAYKDWISSAVERKY